MLMQPRGPIVVHPYPACGAEIAGQARGDPDLPRRVEAIAQPTATPQAIPQPSLGPRLEGPSKTEPRDTPPHSWAGPSSAVTPTTSVPVLLIYWTINTALSTIELKVQVALSLLDGDAQAWATPIFAQLAAVQIQVQGATTPFANEAAFLTAFKACFGNLDDTAAAQVELTKLCADKSLREKCTAAEFSALFKGPVDRSGYGDLELRDKYLGGIPSRVYRKVELEVFITWQDADKRANKVEQILDISRAQRPKLNNFFSARGRGRGGACGGAPQSHGASASINAAVGKGNFPGSCYGCGKQGY
ncbi:predicted protein [Postia placenta Mad-698-R]|uniref:Retrotransposon gag domain-containing protein n=1 Tax=Postia placenta MAD-698-R-SB12 TaxID=670580 RepID=A0A1X6MM45_9APHY|nr:hypothetical protein POSPLADRAFT_1157101 [Postia placenta MAD-698-R-SB12]EED81280.1 predicted protein [Postia placenta Mad-698-R]OSX57517.1 hypothetical protein POSPLADRAFT_1157101 [Postia placenta MAD-698-R-SB12]